MDLGTASTLVVHPQFLKAANSMTTYTLPVSSCSQDTTSCPDPIITGTQRQGKQTPVHPHSHMICESGACKGHHKTRGHLPPHIWHTHVVSSDNTLHG